MFCNRTIIFIFEQCKQKTILIHSVFTNLKLGLYLIFEVFKSLFLWKICDVHITVCTFVMFWYFASQIYYVLYFFLSCDVCIMKLDLPTVVHAICKNKSLWDKSAYVFIYCCIKRCNWCFCEFRAVYAYIWVNLKLMWIPEAEKTFSVVNTSNSVVMVKTQLSLPKEGV